MWQVLLLNSPPGDNMSLHAIESLPPPWLKVRLGGAHMMQYIEWLTNVLDGGPANSSKHRNGVGCQTCFSAQLPYFVRHEYRHGHE
jgi:hypothetical protein